MLLRGVDGILALCWGILITLFSASENRLSSGLEAYVKALYDRNGSVSVLAKSKHLAGGVAPVALAVSELSTVSLMFGCIIVQAVT